jgi:hypothetical protein
MKGRMRMDLATTTLQYTWPIIDPEGEAPLTRAEVLEHAYDELEDLAEQAECLILGPPLWFVQAGAATAGWTAWPGRVLIALIPVHHYGRPRNAAGEPLYTRAEWEEIRAVEVARAEQKARQEADEAREHRERLAAERDDQVRRLHAAGLSITEMVRVTGSKFETIRNAHTRCNLEPHLQRGPRYTKNGPALSVPDRRVTEMHAAGLTITEIARALGSRPGKITIAFERLGLTPPDPCTPITVEPLPADDDRLQLAGVAA